LFALEATITIKGKPSNLVIDGSRFTKVILLEGALSIHVMNSHRVHVINNSGVSSINIDRTHGAFFTLNDGNADISISGSSEISLNLPKEDPELVEIPTQIKTKIKQGKVHTLLVSANNK